MNLPEPPPRTEPPDSLSHGLATLSRSRKARAILSRVWPLALAAATAVGGWVASKLDSKAELQMAIELRQDAELQEQRHAQLIATIEKLRIELLSSDLRQPGRILQIERGQALAFRALSEVRAMTLAGESAKVRKTKEHEGGRFARSFDARLRSGRDPPAVYDELSTGVAVP